MDLIQEDILMLESLLDVRLPKSYKDYLKADSGHKDTESPILGFPLSLDLDSVWGATEFVRAARADLEPSFIVIRIMDSNAVCLDLKSGNNNDAPVVEIDLEHQRPPVEVADSLNQYLAKMRSSAQQDSLPQIEEIAGKDDRWFNEGLKRLEYHMGRLSYGYDHKEGGQLPRSHVWRPYRFCVQDVILGITVIRHNRRYNRLKVDVFLTAQIPEYEADSGCRALALILLSDAYKSGGSMEIKFTGHVEEGQVPRELCHLAKNLGVNLGHTEQGGITPKEARLLYLALSGFRTAVRNKVMELEQEGVLSAASVCYAVHHGVWTAPELETILFSSRFPYTVFTGSFPPEMWHLYHYDLFHGRNALMGGFLDRQLMRREHSLQEKEDSVVELEDDERKVEISFDPEYCAKIYSLPDGEDDILVPWLYKNNEFQNLTLSPGHNLRVLLRARDSEDLTRRINEDLGEAIALKKKNNSDHVCIMLSGDFKRLDMVEVSRKAEENDIGIILCPEFLNQLDQEVGRRFEAVKVMRQ